MHAHNPAPLRYQLMAKRPNMFIWEPEMVGPGARVVFIHRMRAQEEATSSAPPQQVSWQQKAAADALGSAREATIQQGGEDAWLAGDSLFLFDIISNVSRQVHREPSYNRRAASTGRV
jgi:hypothetical protein